MRIGFQWLTGHHLRTLVGVLRREFSRTDNRQRLLGLARPWLYGHRLIIVHERLLRSMIAAARRWLNVNVWCPIQGTSQRGQVRPSRTK